MKILKLKALDKTWEVGDTYDNGEYIVKLSSITKTEVDGALTMFKIYWKVSTVYDDFATIEINENMAPFEMLREVVVCNSYSVTYDITAEANKLVGYYKAGSDAFANLL